MLQIPVSLREAYLLEFKSISCFTPTVKNLSACHKYSLLCYVFCSIFGAKSFRPLSRAGVMGASSGVPMLLEKHKEPQHTNFILAHLPPGMMAVS
jgi:hypothetical protein